MERASQQLRERLALTGERVAAAAARAGRDPAEIRILAVTKTQPRARVEDALEAGLRLIGENRVQEADAKLFPVPPGAELHLIGHLQRNKARAAARLFHTVQSIDKLATAQALQRALVAMDGTMDVLLELNTSGEAAKHGCDSPDELRRALDAMAVLDRLRVRGLMTMAVWSADAGAVRGCFRTLRRLFEDLAPGRPGFDTLSMGMSGDFETAVEEGATLLRLGTVLFGPRGESPQPGART
jgi:pyridoxal phosphate enzyme (YggS family)